MKIAFIITDYGGFNNFLGELATELVKQNEIHVICDSVKIINYKDKFSYSNLGIRFHFVRFSRNFNLFSKIKASIKIKKILARIEPDIVNLHFTSGIFVSLLSGRIKFKTIGVFHGLGFPVIANPIKRFIFKKVEFFCFKRLDQIWLINNHDYELLQKRFPSITFKYNSYGVGCDLSRFDISRFNATEKEAVRKQMNIEPDDFVLMFTGRFVHFKGFDLVIKALKYIDENNIIKNIKLILVGGTDEAHSSNLSKEESYYFQSSRKVINVGFTSEVEKFLSISDLFILPSSKEGMPVCIMEAISMGVPVITLDSRGCNDLVKDNFNGKLLDINTDYLNVADSIIYLYFNRRELSLLSQNTVVERFNFDRKLFIKESVEIFEKNAGYYPPPLKIDNRFTISAKSNVEVSEY